MLCRVFEMLEEVLEGIDAGGEQSRQFCAEIRTLRSIIGYPEPSDSMLEEIQRRDSLAQRLRRMAIEAEGLRASLPTLPVSKWLDGTIHDVRIDVCFEEYDLAELLRFIADTGVSLED
jgi:hypothetical protein